MKRIDSPLDERPIQELQSALKQLAEKNLSDEAQAFFLAELYIEYDQNTKAFEQLEYLLLTDGQVECIPERKEAIKLKLQEVKLEFKAAREGLPNLLTEIKALRSYDSCGKYGCPSNQKAIWSASKGTYVCVGC